MSKQFTELKWDHFRTLNTLKPAVDPLGLGWVGVLCMKWVYSVLRHVMGTINSVMGPLRPGKSSLMPCYGPSFPKMDLLIPSVDLPGLIRHLSDM